ncbi:hypothetical protein CHU95_06135 [Niveispirillum lacus]|uniref:Uncharacterized protein n=1 Tax=Niveispirillum lacus TaxID=1981099 RepID=A0A255Z312_9PROT|nr:hypothetical protein [Niveispirillum lacus]OYQ35846.1 hypothetical protein CHU95_06135 [Niveispirillum lacus]
MQDTSMIDHYRQLVRNTTIDDRTLLSTDYFNHFNEVIMLLSMVSDMPEMLDEIVAWTPKTYRQHFEDSGLAFAPIAIEAFDHVPPEYRVPFDETINDMNSLIVEAVATLSAMRDDPDMLGFTAGDYWRRLQELVDRGSAIVHGSVQDHNPAVTMDQSEIDDLF